MDRLKQECKLCDNIINDENFKVIEDNIKNMFDVLSLKLTLDNGTQNVICTMCSSKLLAALNFKSTYLNRDKSIMSNFDSENNKSIDLESVYAKEKGSEQEHRMLDNREICRLCLVPLSSEHKSIHELPVDSIPIYLPEINFAHPTNPEICLKCYDALCVHSSFVRNCLEIEKKRNVDVGGILLTNPTIKMEEVEIKSELIDKEMLSEILCHIKKEEDEEGETSSHCQYGLAGINETKDLYSFDELRQIKESQETTENGLETPVHSGGSNRKTKPRFSGKNQPIFIKGLKVQYQCDKCVYNTKRKDNLRRHQSIHKDPSEVQMYSCGECDYKTIEKGNLAKHESRWHKDPSQVPMYECGECDYKTFQKVHLKSHQLKHKDPLEVQTYGCDECDYKTRVKSNLTKHRLRWHKDPSEMQTYECGECDYKTFQKSDLKQHELTHKDRFEVQMYSCDQCGFETKHKRNLAGHRLTHRNPTEVQMYGCDACDYKTRRKDNLKLHQLKHKDPSEVPTYLCDECDYKSIRKSNFLRHQLKHTNLSMVPMYGRDECDNKSILKEHLLTHKDYENVENATSEDFETKQKMQV